MEMLGNVSQYGDGEEYRTLLPLIEEGAGRTMGHCSTLEVVIITIDKQFIPMFAPSNFCCDAPYLQADKGVAKTGNAVVPHKNATQVILHMVQWREIKLSYQ